MGSSVDITAEDASFKLREEIKDKNVLITGVAPGNLGFEAARVISRYANCITIADASRHNLDDAVAQIMAQNPYTNIRTLIMDVNSFESVRTAAEEVNAYSDKRIHVLINNTGIRVIDHIPDTIEAVRTHLSTSHLAHFLFTSLIFPRLIASTSTPTSSPSKAARIINVTSWEHTVSDLPSELAYNATYYTKLLAYQQNMTASVLFTNELARRAREKELNILTYSVHPGEIYPPLGSYAIRDRLTLTANGWMNETGEWLLDYLTLGQGAAGYIIAAFDPSIASSSGTRLANAKVTNEQYEPYSMPKKNGILFWDWSEKATNHKFNL